MTITVLAITKYFNSQILTDFCSSHTKVQFHDVNKPELYKSVMAIITLIVAGCGSRIHKLLKQKFWEILTFSGGQGLKNLRYFEERACIGLQKNLDFINKNVRLD